MKLTTAKITGLLYLGVAVTGVVSYLYASQNLYVAGNAAKTAANLVADESLARVGIAAELALVVFQALAGLWFFKLFKKRDAFNAGLIAVFSMVNAIAIMIASAFWLGALNAALANNSSQAQLLYNMHENVWAVSALFFGLWLIPMGVVVKKSKMPRALAWILILGGLGYVISAFTTTLWPAQSSLNDALPMLATVGEFWIIGYLLFKPVKD